MKRLTIIFWLCIALGLCGVFVILTTIPEKLVLDRSEGPAPLEVHIVTPEAYVKQARGVASAWVGCGIRIDWGDGRREDTVYVNESCQDLASHVYYQKGTFRVNAAIGGFPTPDGLSQTTWTGSTLVTVK